MSDSPPNPCTQPAFPWKLWLYTNYDCNLRCSYCLVKSSPNAPRRTLGLENVRRLVTEAIEMGFCDVFLPGANRFS
jgi:molybdenum cofactor biosynthesis enzyme MoaA